MLSLKFAVLVLCNATYFQIQNGPSPAVWEIHLKDIGNLPVPNVLYYRMEHLKTAAGVRGIRGYNQENSGFFTFYFVSKPGFLGLAHLLEEMDLEMNDLEIVAETSEWGRTELAFNIFRVVSNHGLKNYLFAYASELSEGGAALFLLVAPESTFYGLTPSFANMIEDFQPLVSPSSRKAETITPAVILLSVLVLTLNIFFLWLGFREIAKTKSLS